MFSPCSELGIFMYWTRKSMNNLLSYYGLVDPRIRASEKDLPVLILIWKVTINLPNLTQIFFLAWWWLFFVPLNLENQTCFYERTLNQSYFIEFIFETIQMPSRDRFKCQLFDLSSLMSWNRFHVGRSQSRPKAMCA